MSLHDILPDKELVVTYEDQLLVDCSPDKAASIQKWHLRMMQAARYFGTWSKCMSRKIGAVIVRDKTILATGYNGPPRGVAECYTERRIEKLIKVVAPLDDGTLTQKLRSSDRKTCPRKVLGFKSGEGMNFCIAGHAESNAIVNAAREGVRIYNADMYCYCPLPCMNICAKMIINSGIQRVFYMSGPDYDTESRDMFLQAGVTLVGISQELLDKAEKTVLK